MEHHNRHELKHLITEIKNRLHDINKAFFKRNMIYHIYNELGIMWSILHQFRIEQQPADDDLYFMSIQKIAIKCTQMRYDLKPLVGESENKLNKREIAKEYMILRRYVLGLEKSIVKQFYFWDKGVVAAKILTIERAAVNYSKSEITIRRYIKSDFVKAYKLIKIWWIPIEELKR